MNTPENAETHTIGNATSATEATEPIVHKGEENAIEPGMKIASSVAMKEFHRFCEAMNFDINEAFMSRDEKDGFIAARRVFTRAVMQGHLALNADDEPVYTCQIDKKVLTFREPIGSNLAEIDKVSAKEGGEVAQTFRMMASITRRSDNVFHDMKQRDFKICKCILGFFSG